MSLLDKYFIDDTFKDRCLRYLFSLQSILMYKTDANDWQTPYQLETNRQNAHRKLFDDAILPMLRLEEGSDENDAYMRSKDIFGNLDKVWKIYDDSEMDLTDDSCIPWMVIYLWKLISSTEGKFFLEGRTQYIHGIHIPL